MEILATAFNWFILVVLMMLTFSFIKTMKSEKKGGCCGGKDGDCCGGKHNADGSSRCCKEK